MERPALAQALLQQATTRFAQAGYWASGTERDIAIQRSTRVLESQVEGKRLARELVEWQVVTWRSNQCGRTVYHLAVLFCIARSKTHQR
jgi:hypothetical protein